jgi:hypothetical protein
MTRDLMRLIDQRADWHLANWARWMRTCEVGIGYPHASAGLSSGGLVSGDDSFDHMADEADRQTAKIADAAINELDPRSQCAISNVYLASVFRFRGDIGEVFQAAAEEFWRRAKRKGLA